MANKTIDRKKAIAARPQAAKASPKSASAKSPRPAVGKEEPASSVKLDEATQSERAEVLEEEELEAEDLAVDEEVGDSEEEEGEAEERLEPEPAEERRLSRRERRVRERGLVAAAPSNQAVSKPVWARLPQNALVRFLVTSYWELLKVNWPTWHETWNWSLVVVGVCVTVGVILGAVDFLLARGVEWWVSLAH